jgi:arabinofuranosyltransferase
VSPAVHTHARTRPLARVASSRAAYAVALVVFSVVFVANAWVGDDAFISFRVSDNIAHGYGPRWNVAERVQAFTDPLWTFVMALADRVTGEVFYTSMVVSFLLCVGMIAILWRWLRRDVDRWLALTLLLSSKAFIDYTSSGLEYALSYLLLTAFVAVFVWDLDEPLVPARRLRRLTLLAALAFVNRADTILLYLPALLSLLVRRRRELSLRELGRLIVAAAPAWGWLLFALLYYGFPFPNTYYAKVHFGAPHWLQLHQGFAYVASSVRFDPITLGTIAAAIAVAWPVRDFRFRGLAAGAAAYVAYTVWVGGDFMAGRFFSLPFLLAVLLLAWLPKRRRSALAAIAALLLLNLVNPLAPLKTIPNSDIGWQWRLQNGVKDERGAHNKSVNPLTYEVFRVMPDNPLAREGRSYAASPDTVFVHPWIGLIGYYAGPSKYIIDPNALSDPLLARLPVGQDFYFAFWVSHWTRQLPQGYVESRRAHANLIADPRIHEFFDRILTVTEGPVFSLRRFHDIFDLNWGRFRRFSDEIRSVQKLEYETHMDNPLFTTDVGELNRTEMRTAGGRAGYLVLGPGIPLAAGTYRVHWSGFATPGPGGTAGFVQVCYRDCRTVLASAPLVAAASSGILADVTVRAGRDVRDIEYRVFAAEGARVTVQSLAIRQQ